MSAKEMFEELGYELVETNSAGVKLTMIEYYNFETTSTINFWTPINIDIDLQMWISLIYVLDVINIYKK